MMECSARGNAHPVFPEASLNIVAEEHFPEALFHFFAHLNTVLIFHEHTQLQYVLKTHSDTLFVVYLNIILNKIKVNESIFLFFF